MCAMIQTGSPSMVHAKRYPELSTNTDNNQNTQENSAVLKGGDTSLLHSDVHPEEPKAFGPLTQEEAEQLQREANEDTTRSEDLRQFLKEMHEKLMEEQQQQQQQNTLIPPIQPIPGHAPVIANTLHAGPPSTSQYSLMAAHPGPDPEVDDLQAGRPSQIGPPVHGLPRLTSQVTRPSLTDLTAPDNPPDGGWGWIVVLGSFCCMILVDGICLSYGLLLTPQCGYSSLRAVTVIRTTNQSGSSAMPLRPEFLRADRSLRPVLGSCVPVSEMGEALGTQDRALLLTPGALLIGLYLLLGPLVSALSNQFDFRPVAMVGAAVSTLALFCSAFATSIDFLIASFGLLGGTGFALIYLPAIATVGHWFQQRRPLAVGLALCGSGVGCLLGAQAVPRLVDWLTWRGAMITLAAISFQCMSLIVLFRPLEIHVRITQVQRAKRAAREAARRAAALRRAEAERALYEARERKRLAALAKAAEVQAMGQKHHAQQRASLERGTLGARKFDVQTGATLRSGSGQAGALHGVVGPRGGRVGTVVTRTSRGGRVLQIGPPGTGHAALSGTDSTRAAGTGAGWLRHRSSSARGKRAPSRRVVVYRGSIMQRIIEEKRRQRTISVGSLDGMVITRDNELIAAPLAPNYDRPLLSASAIHRISEAVARKIEAKMQTQQQLGGPLAPSVGASRVGLSRSQLRISLPQVVQEYIQSQLSITLQQQQQQQHKQSVMSNASFCVSAAQLPMAATTNPTTHPIVATTVPPTGQSVVDAVNPPIPAFGQSTPLGTIHPSVTGGLPLNAVGPQNPATFVPTPESPDQQHYSVAVRLRPLMTLATTFGSNCPSDSTSLRRTVSDASLESRVHAMLEAGIGVPDTSGTRIADTDVANNANLGAELLLLDDEIKAEIHARLKREMSRPQYKKDLFYTGSVVQLSSNQLAADQLGNMSPGPAQLVSPSGLLMSSSMATGPRSQATRTVSTVQVPLDQAIEVHNSQTNISIVTSVGAATTSFIPPAPCPPVQPSLSVGAAPLAVPITTDAVDMLTGQSHSSAQHPQHHSAQQEPSTMLTVPPDPTHHSHEPSLSVGAVEHRLSAYISSASTHPSREPAVSNLTTGSEEHPDRRLSIGAVDHDDLDIDDDSDDDRHNHHNIGVDDDDDVDEDDDEDEVDGLDADTVEPHSNGLGGRCSHCLATFCCGPCLSTLFDSLGPMSSFVHELLSPWILTSVTFGFMLLSSTATMMGLTVPYLMLPDLLAELNWKLADSGFAICAIGVGNTVGRLVATIYIEKAWSATYKWADCLWLNNGSLFLTAMAVFAMPLSRTYYSLLVLLCIAFGLFSAVFVSLKSILVVELLGLDRLTNSFGYMLLFQGLAAIVGPPIAGYLRDAHLAKYPIQSVLLGHLAPIHQSSAVGFYFSGACLLVASILACPLRWLSRYEFTSAAVETRASISNMPGMDLIGPGYHAPYEYPGHTGDGDWIPVEQINQGGVTNYAAYLSDAMSPGLADIPDYHMDHHQLPQQQQQVTPPTEGIANSSLPVPATGLTNVPAVPGLVMDLGPPCMLSTINEGGAVDNANVLMAGVNPVPSTTATTPLTHSPAVDDVSGLAATMLGVSVPVMANSAPAQAVEVMTVPEESGLEPVVEEEEEDEYEDDEDGVDDNELKDRDRGLGDEALLARSSADSEISPGPGRERSATSIAGSAAGTTSTQAAGSDSSQSRDPKGLGDMQSSADPGQQTTWKRKKRKRTTRKSQAETLDTPTVDEQSPVGETKEPDNPLV